MTRSSTEHEVLRIEQQHQRQKLLEWITTGTGKYLQLELASRPGAAVHNTRYVCTRTSTKSCTAICMLYAVCSLYDDPALYTTAVQNTGQNFAAAETHPWVRCFFVSFVRR